MSKLSDVFVEWSSKGKRWPLLFILLVPAYFTFFLKYYNIEFGQVFEKRAFLWSSAITIAFSVFLYILLNIHEKVVTSRVMDFIRKGRRVSITKPLAWKTLTYDEGNGVTRSVSVVKEIGFMLRRLRIHPVVIPQPQVMTLPVTPRDQFVLDGVVSPLGFVLRSIVILSESESLEIAERLIRGIVSSKELSDTGREVTVPLQRVLDYKSLIDTYIYEISISSEISSQQQIAITRLFLHFALMTMLYRDRHPSGKRVVRTMNDIGELLSPMENKQIAKIYRAAAFNLVTVDENFPEAIRALKVARKFAPSDSSTIAMQAILSMYMGQLEETKYYIDQFQEVSEDKGLISWLKADYYMSSNQPEIAIAPFEEAIKFESNEVYQQTMHFQVAFAYAMSERLSSRQQGDGMIRHLEDAIQIEENPIYFVLKSYGWALRGDVKQFEANLSKTAVLMNLLPEQVQEGLKPFVENWKARGLRKLNQSSEVAEHVLGIIGAPEESYDVANLLVLAGASLDLAGVKGDPEHLAAAKSYVDRVITLEPHNFEAIRYRGLIYTLYAENTTDSVEKERFGKDARDDFHRLIRMGHEMPTVHAVLARLYDLSRDPVNAAKHRARWLELSPNDPEAIAYQALTIFDQTGDLVKAKSHLERIDETNQELGKVYRILAAEAVGNMSEETEDNTRTSTLELTKECLFKAINLGDKETVTYNLLAAILNELALTYHSMNMIDKAADNYAKYLEFDPTSFNANNNLAFILFDKDDYIKAAHHWEQALESSPDQADAAAGMAAALHSLGKDDEALSYYKKAVSLSPVFLDKNKMRDQYSWSDKALEAVEAFIEEFI